MNQFTFLQFKRISPLFPVRGFMFPISNCATVWFKGARLESPPSLRQMHLSSFAKCELTLESLQIWSLKVAQRAFPIVWPLEKAIRSFSFRPWLLKLLISSESQAKKWCWNVCICCFMASCGGVSSPQSHLPCWSHQLHRACT